MTKKEKIKVDKISITICDQTINLTPVQLKELRDILNETFPEVKENYTPYIPYIPIDITPTWPTRPYRYWETPIWCSPKDSEFQNFQITCKT